MSYEIYRFQTEERMSAGLVERHLASHGVDSVHRLGGTIVIGREGIVISRKEIETTFGDVESPFTSISHIKQIRVLGNIRDPSNTIIEIYHMEVSDDDTEEFIREEIPYREGEELILDDQLGIGVILSRDDNFTLVRSRRD